MNDPSAEFFVPDLFYIECANVLWKYVQSNLYTAKQQEDITDLKALRFQVISTKGLMSEAVKIGVDYNITAYDGCYVALSKRVGAPLLTLDERLANSLRGSSFDVRLFTDFSVPLMSN